MKIRVIAVGKCKEKYVSEGIKVYLNKLRHYCHLELVEIKDVETSGSQEQVKEREAVSISNFLKDDYTLVCLDENGKQFTSEQWAAILQQYQNRSVKNLIFVIGGAFGIHHSLMSKAELKLSLSRMTFNHEMVRIFFLEQLYRGFTILKNEKYHNP